MKPERGHDILEQAQRAIDLSDNVLLRLEMEIENDATPTPEALQALGYIAFELNVRNVTQQAEV